MSGAFAVVRHPDAGVAIATVESLAAHEAKGWVRVSDFRNEPSDFVLADFKNADVWTEPDGELSDVDAEPDPAAPPVRTTSKRGKRL